MSDDPLEGAAVGETRTVTRTTTISALDLEPAEFWGFDRQRDSRIADVEAVSHDDDADDVRITLETDLTKRLPRRWDECDEPRTAAERRSATWRKWRRRGGQALGFIFSIGFVSTVAAIITSWAFDGSATINGQPMTAPSIPTMAGAAFLLVILAAIITWAACSFPPMGGATPR